MVLEGTGSYESLGFVFASALGHSLTVVARTATETGLGHRQGSRLVLDPRAGGPHAWEVGNADRADIPLNQAPLSAAPAFHPNCAIAPFHFVNCGGAELRAQRRQRPAGGIEHAHSTLAIDQDGDIVIVGIAGHRDIQDVFCLL